MADELRQTGEAVAARRAARIGLFWGGWFGVPFLLLAMLLALDGSRSGDASMRLFAAAMASCGLTMIFAGRAWALRPRIGEWPMLAAAALQGFWMWMLQALAFAAPHLSGGDAAPETLLPDAAFNAVAWAACSLWSLASGALILWRVRRNGLSAPPDRDTDAGGHSGPHEWLVGVAILLLLCAPFVLALRHGATLRGDANAVLEARILQLRAGAPDLADMNRTQARLLARIGVVEVLDANLPRALDALDVAGHWPEQAQLVSLEMDGRRLVLSMRGDAPAMERDLLAQLAAHGYRDAYVLARSAGAITVAAQSGRGDGGP